MDDALDLAFAIDERDARSEAVTALAGRLPPERRIQALGDVLAAGRTIEDEAARSQALAALAGCLPESSRTVVLRDALRAAREAKAEDERATALSELAARLPNALVDEALEIAQAINQNEIRLQALWSLAPRLSEDRRARTLSDALRTLRAIAFEWSRSQWLAAVAGQLDGELAGEALEVTSEIRHEWHRASALAALAERLPDARVGEALEIANAMTEPVARSRTQRALATRFGDDARRRMLADALDAARSIEDGAVLDDVRLAAGARRLTWPQRRGSSQTTSAHAYSAKPSTPHAESETSGIGPAPWPCWSTLSQISAWPIHYLLRSGLPTSGGGRRRSSR